MHRLFALTVFIRTAFVFFECLLMMLQVGGVIRFPALLTNILVISGVVLRLGDGAMVVGLTVYMCQAECGL